MYISENRCVMHILLIVGGSDCSSIPTKPADSQIKRTTHANCCTYILLPPDDGQTASPKHVEV
jgi:hypothetical protein